MSLETIQTQQGKVYIIGYANVSKDSEGNSVVDAHGTTFTLNALEGMLDRAMRRYPDGIPIHVLHTDLRVGRTLPELFDVREKRIYKTYVNQHGLHIVGVLDETSERAKEVVRAIGKDGMTGGLSISFYPLKTHMEDGIEIIDDADLDAISIVLDPDENSPHAASNPLSRFITFVRAVKGYVPEYKRYPHTPKDKAWDGDGARRRLREWANGDMKKYAKGFALVVGDPDNFGSYKLPHHDIVDGRLVTVYRGVVAAIQALKGARGGVNAPQDLKEKALRHLQKHLKEFENVRMQSLNTNTAEDLNMTDGKELMTSEDLFKQTAEALKILSEKMSEFERDINDIKSKVGGSEKKEEGKSEIVDKGKENVEPVAMSVDELMDAITSIRSKWGVKKDEQD